MIDWNPTTMKRVRMALDLHDGALRSLQQWKRYELDKVHVANEALNNWEMQLKLRIAENMDAIDEALDALDVTEILTEIYKAA